jgi:hypothetical protein
MNYRKILIAKLPNVVCPSDRGMCYFAGSCSSQTQLPEVNILIGDYYWSIPVSTYLK